MDPSAKVATIRTLSEKELRRDLFIPLLVRMGFKSAVEYHGPREHGKDIICFDIDRLGQRRYLAIVAKVGDLTGSVSSNSGLSEAVTQAEQCFNEDYHDLFGMRTITMDEVWIVTTGRVISGAADSVMGRLKKTNLAKLVRILSGEQLVDLIDAHYASYWNEAAEPADLVRGERDRLQVFVRMLLRKLGATEDGVSGVLSQIHNSSFLLPTVDVINPAHWSVRYASSYSVTLEEGSGDYIKGLFSEACGPLHEALLEAKETLRFDLRDVEETLEAATEALSTPDPWTFVHTFNDRLSDEHPFHRSMFAKSPRTVEYLADGLRDIDDFLERLDKAGNREDVLVAIKQIEAMESRVSEYLTGVDSDEFQLFWVLSMALGAWSIRLAYDDRHEKGEHVLSTTHRRLVDNYRRWGPKERPITARDVIRSAQAALRTFIDTTILAEREDAKSSV